MTIFFDTLELSKPHFTPEQAEALAKSFVDSANDQVATKADVAELRAEMREGFAKARVEMSAFATVLNKEIAEGRAETALLATTLGKEIAQVRTETAGLFTALGKEISLARADTIPWIVSAIAFDFLATAGFVLAVVKAFGR